jgi:hypothetical protein
MGEELIALATLPEDVRSDAASGNEPNAGDDIIVADKAEVRQCTVRCDHHFGVASQGSYGPERKATHSKLADQHGVDAFQALMLAQTLAYTLLLRRIAGLHLRNTRLARLHGFGQLDLRQPLPDFCGS